MFTLFTLCLLNAFLYTFAHALWGLRSDHSFLNLFLAPTCFFWGASLALGIGGADWHRADAFGIAGVMLLWLMIYDRANSYYAWKWGATGTALLVAWAICYNLTRLELMVGIALAVTIYVVLYRWLSARAMPKPQTQAVTVSSALVI
jgi:hypothetical protein